MVDEGFAVWAVWALVWFVWDLDLDMAGMRGLRIRLGWCFVGWVLIVIRQVENYFECLIGNSLSMWIG